MISINQTMEEPTNPVLGFQSLSSQFPHHPTEDIKLTDCKEKTISGCPVLEEIEVINYRYPT